MGFLNTSPIFQARLTPENLMDECLLKKQHTILIFTKQSLRYLHGFGPIYVICAAYDSPALHYLRECKPTDQLSVIEKNNTLNLDYDQR